ILTRVNILASQLIDLNHWQAVVDTDLETLQTRYHFDASSASSQDIEKLLIDQALSDFQLLFRPFSGLQRDMLNYAVHWYELANLKVLIRGKFTGMSESTIHRELIDLGQFAVLPLSRLLETDDPYEMLRLLEKTAYSNIVKQARTIFEEEGQNLFALDSAIDRHFFSGLMQRVRFLPLGDQQQLTTVLGTMMDRLNLLWLIRYRFTYRLSPAKSYYLLATTGKKLHAGNLMQLARVETVEELIEQLPAPLSQLLSQADSLTEIENRMEHYTLSATRTLLQYSTSGITRVFCYVLLRESEIHLLQSIIKGKMLAFDEALIHQAIGMKK
ncbi:MAG: V-type ATPase subunit, partial [Gammaproteobacteria bacterium]|nr:V-type ATPase subunit [Gammaproteobacteria bacterium]